MNTKKYRKRGTFEHPCGETTAIWYDFRELPKHYKDFQSIIAKILTYIDDKEKRVVIAAGGPVGAMIIGGLKMRNQYARVIFISDVAVSKGYSPDNYHKKLFYNEKKIDRDTARVFLFEDVVMTGDRARLDLEILNNDGFKIEMILCLKNRSELPKLEGLTVKEITGEEEDEYE